MYIVNQLKNIVYSFSYSHRRPKVIDVASINTGTTNEINTCNTNNMQLDVSDISSKLPRNENEEWEYIKTKEELELEEIKKKRNQEFAYINDMATIKTKIAFRKKAEEFLLSKNIDLKNSYLNSNERSKLLHDVLVKYQEKICNSIITKLEDVNNLAFIPQHYCKNVFGQMVSLGFFVSSHNGLTAQALGEMLWSMWLSLCKAVRDHRKRCLTKEEKDVLFDLIFSLIDSICVMWLETVKHVGESREKEGILPLKWANEKKVIIIPDYSNNENNKTNDIVNMKTNDFKCKQKMLSQKLFNN